MGNPFDLAWSILKGDADWYPNALWAIQNMFGVDKDTAWKLMEQMHRHQLSQAGIPQDKIDREYDPEQYGSHYINYNFMYPLSNALLGVKNTIDDTARLQQKKDERSRLIGQRASNEAFARRGLRGNPRVPQTDEEASYANISLRESPLYGLEPFGEDEPIGATLPMLMADDIEDDILEPIRQRKREEEPFNPFTVKPSPPSPPPMREERSPPMGGTEGMSRGPMRSRKRGNPASPPRFIRPGFRSTEAMPLTDKSAENRMKL